MARFYLFITVAAALMHTLGVNAQTFVQQFGGFPVTVEGGVLCISPFNGGIDVPRFQMVDIDGDGLPDLFIFDRDTTLNFYKNTGSPGNPVFTLTSLKYLNLPIQNWFYFVDIDANGTYDLFTGGTFQTIQYFKNTGTVTNPNFVLTINPVKTNTDSIIYSQSVCNPTFADIDANGTLDFFTGNTVGTVTYYKNIGTPQNFNFQFITDQFAGISIIGGGNSSDRPAPQGKQPSDLHGASSIIFTDIRGAGKLDLFWGDYFGRSIYYIQNTGTPQIFNWNVIDTFYPPPTPWISLGYNMPKFYDIRNVGLKDMFIGVLYGAQTKENFIYYKNLGPLSNPQFTQITKNYIPCIDVGSNSLPVFTDIRNSGVYDLFIGSSNATIAYYKNIGTAISPSFQLITDSLPILSTSFNYAPAFGDLDGDGKKDMVLGSYDGKLRFFKNTGTASNPVFTFTSSQLDTIDVGQSSTPALVDIRGAGVLDMFVGNWDGRISYYKNVGTPANFIFVYVTNYYLNIDIGDESNLCFSDINNDGKYDMFIGRRDGKVTYYRNDGTPGNPNFVWVTDNFANVQVGSNSVPAVVDLHGSSYKDLFVGNIKGGLYYYVNSQNIGIIKISSQVPTQFTLYQNYPNPFNPTTKIRFQIPPSKGARGMNNEGLYARLIIYDILGREITTLLNEQLRPGTYEVEWNASGLASGVYFYRLTYGDFSDAKKMVLVK